MAEHEKRDLVSIEDLSTAEILEALGAPYSGTDIVGRSGLERALESRLAGIPYQEVQLVNKYGRVLEVLAIFDAVPPTTWSANGEARARRSVASRTITPASASTPSAIVA